MNAETLRTLSTEVSRPIVEMSSHVAHLLSRFLDLHQITTAIVPILANPDQLAAMRASWRMLDASFIVRQCAMACDCSEAILEPSLAAFDVWLAEAGSDPSIHPVEQLAACVDSALSRAELAPGVGTPRMLIPRAVFLTSQVMRLLTLRSDPSFGWFQLIKTWVDDYVAVACARRSAFVRDIDPTLFPPVPAAVTTQPQQPQPQQQSHGHGTPNLAIDTASAGYQSVPPLDGNAITPRPAFTSSGAATQATGPNVGGVAGQPTVSSVNSTPAMTPTPAPVAATAGFM